MTAQNRRAVSSAALALLAAGGCGTLLTPPAPLASAPPGADVPQDTTRLLRSLVVAADVDPGGYDRERFNYPQGGTDARGCSTRARVLLRDSLDPPRVSWPGCKVLAGRWLDPYTGVTYTSPAEVSIDHVVPLKESSLGNLGSVEVSQTRLTDLWPPRSTRAPPRVHDPSPSLRRPPSWILRRSAPLPTRKT